MPSFDAFGATGRKKRNTGLIKHLDQFVRNKLPALRFKQAFALQHVRQTVCALQQCSGGKKVRISAHAGSSGLDQVGCAQSEEHHEKCLLEGGTGKATT